MKTIVWLVGIAGAGAWDDGGADDAAALKQVAARFTGTPGVFLHLGDSLTYAQQNTAWARLGRRSATGAAGAGRSRWPGWCWCSTWSP